MPCGRLFEFSVSVGGKRLKEYVKDEEVYVESNLTEPDVSYQLQTTELAFGEEESQLWPVTPYQINLRTTPSGKQQTYWYEVYCDGVYVWNRPVTGQRDINIDGFTNNGVNRELLFSLPRFARHEMDRIDRERLSEVGRITVRCIEANYIGERTVESWNYKDFSQKESLVGAGDGFDQANKKDINKLGRDQQGAMTTKAGREKFRFTPSNCPVYYHRKHFKRGKLVEVLNVNYRMKQALIDMGLIEGQLSASSVTTPEKPIIIPTEETMKTCESSPEDMKSSVRIKQENLIDQTLSKMKEMNLSSMSVIDSKKHIKEEIITRINAMGEEEKVIVRQNRIAVPEKRIIQIDDDIQMIEELDDSVVYIGDEECCCIDGPPEEIPFVEL